MFTIQLEKQSKQFKDMVEVYFAPDCDKIVTCIDFTYGQGSLWLDMKTPHRPCGKQHVVVTKTDKEPPLVKWEKAVDSLAHEIMLDDSFSGDEDDKHLTLEECRAKALEILEKPTITDVFKKDLFVDDYSDLGLHDFGVFDPPALIGRTSFDYPWDNTKKKKGKKVSFNRIVPTALTGKRSWSASDLSAYVENPSEEYYNERVSWLNKKAISVLKPGAILFCKIFNPRHKGELVDFRCNTKHLLTNFKLLDELAYTRQGATTWASTKHFQNLHGFWDVYQLRGPAKPVIQATIPMPNLSQTSTYIPSTVSMPFVQVSNNGEIQVEIRP